MKHTDIMTPEEIRHFSRKSNLSAGWILLSNWLMIAAIFAMVAAWTHPLTILLAIILLGGRQLGLGVIMHECGHANFFEQWKLNRVAGQWCAAAFIFSNAKRYRIGHNRHHRLGGTKDDPDLQNYVNYAVFRKSFIRKILRDITGLTGLKLLYLSARGFGPKNVAIWIAAHTALWAVLYITTGHGWLYLLWPAAWLTSYMLYSRIRNAAEHASVPDLFDPDPRKHTRTTYARWFERLTVAPNHVNYHLEHHVLPSVPCYHLKEFHHFMLNKGVLQNADLCHGYGDVIKRLIKPHPSENIEATV